MYLILSFIFFVAAIFACGNIEHLIGLAIVSSIFAVADSINSLSIEKVITDNKTEKK